MPRQPKKRDPKTDRRTSALVSARIPVRVEYDLDDIAEIAGLSRSAMAAKFIIDGVQEFKKALAEAQQ